MELFGKITKIFDTQTVGNNGFEKRDFVITTEEQYPQEIILQMVQGNVKKLDEVTLNNVVKVTFEVKGRKWTSPEGKETWFNTLQAWKIEPH